MDTALVVHDRDFSMFKPAGDASYCSSVHGTALQTHGSLFALILTHETATVLLGPSGPHCPQLRDRFAEDAPLAELGVRHERPFPSASQFITLK